MKKIIIILFAVLFMTTAAFAGQIGTIVGVDILVGTIGGAALGAALSVPSFLDGNGENSLVFAAGAGWGSLIGAGLGLIYSIWNINYYLDMKKGGTGIKKKSFLGTDDFYVSVDMINNGIKVTQKF